MDPGLRAASRARAALEGETQVFDNVNLGVALLALLQSVFVLWCYYQPSKCLFLARVCAAVTPKNWLRDSGADALRPRCSSDAAGLERDAVVASKAPPPRDDASRDDAMSFAAEDLTDVRAVEAGEEPPFACGCVGSPDAPPPRRESRPPPPWELPPADFDGDGARAALGDDEDDHEATRRLTLYEACWEKLSDDGAFAADLPRADVAAWLTYAAMHLPAPRRAALLGGYGPSVAEHDFLRLCCDALRGVPADVVDATTDLYLAKRAKRHRVMARAVTDAVDGACLFVFPLCYGVAMIVLFNVEFRDSYADVDDGEVLEPNFHAGQIALKTCVFVFALLAATAAYHKAPDVRA